MWNKRVGAQILLYGSYVGAVLLVVGIVFLLFGGTLFATIVPGKIGSGGFVLMLLFSIMYGAIGGFVLWCMYTAGKDYLENGVFDQWKVWVVLVLSALGLLQSLTSGGSFTAVVLSILINGLFVFGAAAMLFAEEESQ